LAGDAVEAGRVCLADDRAGDRVTVFCCDLAWCRWRALFAGALVVVAFGSVAVGSSRAVVKAAS
jgi:hypothetical protein